MKVKYFKDTDTAHLEFSGQLIEETREISENVYVDLDQNGDLVGMTIEHAASRARFPEVIVEQVEDGIVQT